MKIWIQRKKPEVKLLFSKWIDFLKILLENMRGLTRGSEKSKKYDFLNNNIKFLIWKNSLRN